MSDLNEIKNLIAASSECIAKKIDLSQKSLEQKFNELACKVEGDVSAVRSSFEEFKSEISAEINEMKMQLSNQAQRIENNEDDIQHMQKSRDLRITGYHVKANEDLRAFFNVIAREIGFADTQHLRQLYAYPYETAKLVL